MRRTMSANKVLRNPTKPVRIIDILVSGEAAIDRLAKEAYQTVPAVLARSAVRDKVTGHRGQAKGIIEFPMGEQANVGGDP